MKTAIVIIGVISCFTMGTAFADDSDFMDEVKAFKDDYPQAGLSYDSAKQIVTSIHGIDFGKVITNEAEAAETAVLFLESYPALFRLRDVEYSLTDTTFSGSTYFVYFKQFYNTIPVWNA